MLEKSMRDNLSSGNAPDQLCRGCVWSHDPGTGHFVVLRGSVLCGVRAPLSVQDRERAAARVA